MLPTGIRTYRKMGGVLHPKCAVAQIAGNQAEEELRMGSAVVDGFLGKQGLLAEAIGDFGEFALIGTDCGKIGGLADEAEGAKGSPTLLGARIDRSHFSARRYVSSRGNGKRANAAADGGAHLRGLL